MMKRALALLLLLAAPATAQSAYGCAGLDGRGGFGAVEGEGAFFRLDPDLLLGHALPEGSADGLARLSEALAGQGTTLIVVPLPTKAMAMPGALPALARDLGYDPGLAATVYGEWLDRLAERGVAAVDARTALLSGEGEAPSFLATDPRLSAEGARRLAQAVAAAVAEAPGTAALQRGRFETAVAQEIDLDSSWRARLQRRCAVTLPRATVEATVTTRLDAAPPGDPLGGATAPVLIAAAEEAGDPRLNLAGLVSQATDLPAAAYAVEGGGAFGAISAVMTSRPFAAARPAVLVWVLPVWEGLAERGPRPLAELVAAAGAACRLPVPLALSGGPEATADLAGLDPARRWTLLVDADAPARAARFDLQSATGLTRRRTVARGPAQVATGRFLLPLDGLWAAGAARAAIALDVPWGPSARVTACEG